jgi:hypothetical protein
LSIVPNLVILISQFFNIIDFNHPKSNFGNLLKFCYGFASCVLLIFEQRVRGVGSCPFQFIRLRVYPNFNFFSLQLVIYFD